MICRKDFHPFGVRKASMKAMRSAAIPLSRQGCEAHADEGFKLPILIYASSTVCYSGTLNVTIDLYDFDFHP